MRQLIDAVKKHAEDHYNDGGWDVIVECWTESDIADYLKKNKVKDANQAIAAVKEIVDVYADRQADAINSAF